MAIAATGAISLSDFRTEFIGGSSAVSLSDLYRGGSNVRSKAANNTATNLAANLPTSGAIDFADFYGTAKGFRKTYTTTATNQNASSVFGDDYGVDYPKEIVINSGVELGATTTGEEALQIDSGLSGTMTITNNGTLSGAGGAAGGGAGGDAFEANVACTLINNGTIRAGGGGGGNGGSGGTGGTGGQGSSTSTSTRTINYDHPNYAYRRYYWSGTTTLNFAASYTGGGGGTSLSVLPSGVSATQAYSGSASANNGSGTFSHGGVSFQRAFNGHCTGGTVTYTMTGTTGSGSIYVYAVGTWYGSGMSLVYNSSYYTTTNYHSGGAGGAGGSGGSGGQGQGYNHGNQNGSSGSAGAGGSAGGTNAGAGGQGGTGGTGGNGGTYGNSGGNGATGATGNTGANGNHTNGSGGSGGSGGSSGGAAGNYIRGLSNVTFTNNGTVQGGTA